MPTQRKTITIEKPFGGWASSPTYTNGTSLTGSVEGQAGQYGQSTAISLFKAEKFGHISPGEVFTPLTDAATRITELPLNGATASNGKAFMVLKNSRVVQTDIDGTATNAHYDVSMGGTHAAHTLATSSSNGDLIVAKDAAASPGEYVLWSWEDGNDADVALVTAGGASQDNDWFSTLTGTNAGVLTKSVPLKMTQGPDGNIYITNGQFIASATMAAGTAMTGATGNKQALNLGAGWTASGITNWKTFIAILGYKSTSYAGGNARNLCRVWLWDGFSPDPNFIYDIPDNNAMGIFFDGATLMTITAASTGLQIREFNGSDFILKFTTGLVRNAIPQPFQGSIDQYQHGLHMSLGTSAIYQFYAGGFHSRMVATDGTNAATSVGMVRNLYAGSLWVGVGISGGLYKVYKETTGSYVNATLRTRLFTSYDDKSAMTGRDTLKKVRVYFSQTGTGNSVKLSLYKNYSTTPDHLNRTITTTNKYFSFESQVDDLESFYMDILFNHATISTTHYIIRKIVLEFEISDNY